MTEDPAARYRDGLVRIRDRLLRAAVQPDDPWDAERDADILTMIAELLDERPNST